MKRNIQTYKYGREKATKTTKNNEQVYMLLHVFLDSERQTFPTFSSRYRFFVLCSSWKLHSLSGFEAGASIPQQPLTQPFPSSSLTL